MTATCTIRTTGHTGLETGLEAAAAWMKELPAAGRTALMLAGGPLLGLAFIVALPVAGLVLAAWMAVRAAARKWAGAGAIVKRVALFAAAPFFGLAYLIAFPFVGLGALVWYGFRAARK